MQFQQLYQQQPCAEPNELTRLAWEYHLRTERYDQIICSRFLPSGIAMPADAHEAATIRSYARRLFSAFGEEAARRGADLKTWQRTVNEVSQRLHGPQAFQRLQDYRDRWQRPQERDLPNPTVEQAVRYLRGGPEDGEITTKTPALCDADGLTATGRRPSSCPPASAGRG